MFLSNFLKGLLLIPEPEHEANLRHAGILFHWCMLQDLRKCVWKLSAESFADIKSYVEPPALVHSIVKAVLLLFHPDWKGSEETENWSQCKLVRLQNVETLISLLPSPKKIQWNYLQISYLFVLAIFSSVALSLSFH